MLDFNLKQLEAFVAAAELGSFTKAAQSLYLTQSTVSAHIQTLERALGISLFARSARKKICLTDAGREAYSKAKEILDQCQALADAVHPKRTMEVLSIAASTVPSKCILPNLMAGFLAVHPNGRYCLQKGDSTQVHRLLAQKDARIGFVGAVLDDTQFLYHPLLRDKLVLLTANSEKFRALQSQGALGCSLLREPMVVREDGSGTHQRFGAYLEQLGMSMQQLDIVAQIDQPETILRTVESGVGITVYSALAAAEQLQAGRLLAFELEPGSFYRELYLVTERDAVLTRLEMDFIHFTLDHYSSR